MTTAIGETRERAFVAPDLAGVAEAMVGAVRERYERAGAGPGRGSDPAREDAAREDLAREDLAELVTLQRAIGLLQAAFVEGHARLVAHLAADLLDDPVLGGGPARAARGAATLAGDEIMAATGMGPGEVHRLTRLATAPVGVRAEIVAALREGRTLMSRATAISDEVHHLPDEQPEAKERVAQHALAPRRGHDRHDVSPDGLIKHATFRTRLSSAMCREESRLPDHEHTRRSRLAERGVSAGIDAHGVGSLAITGAADQVAAAHERIDVLARRLKAAGEDDGRTLPQLRSDIALHLLSHGHDDQQVPVGAVPRAQIQVRVGLLTLLGLSDDPAWIEGYGPVPAEVARDIALRPESVWHRVVTDPVTGAALTGVPATGARATEAHAHGDGTGRRVGYRPTAAMRAQVEARDVTCRAPGCTWPAVRCELDHAVPWPQGRTCPCNLIALCKGHHQRKTYRRWSHTLHPDGSATFVTRLGQTLTTSPWQDDDPTPAPWVVSPCAVSPCAAPRDAGQEPGWAAYGSSGPAVPRASRSAVEDHLRPLVAPDLLRELAHVGPDGPPAARRTHDWRDNLALRLEWLAPPRHQPTGRGIRGDDPPF
ncbi:HNH endonuclease signature motif containing protein [Arsenicicoccus sp. oral taxon 190]|uniref:HNH endonuclease signature motif containing protein n=1 Tax=Arsenicicoccus sp. oral taxon 190 TaxID=1658671 RepID=UPI00067B7578|nr:HNH endonuclease signature motif containing protein [Arsenicicoccus sp. oral taxon 190]